MPRPLLPGCENPGEPLVCRGFVKPLMLAEPELDDIKDLRRLMDEKKQDNETD